MYHISVVRWCNYCHSKILSNLLFKTPHYCVGPFHGLSTLKMYITHNLLLLGSMFKPKQWGLFNVYTKMFPVDDHSMRILCHNVHPAAELIIRGTNVRLHNTIAWSPTDVTAISKLIVCCGDCIKYFV